MSRKNKKEKKQKANAAKPFSEKKQERYTRIARLQYGPELVNESVQRWSSYSKAEQQAIMDEGGKNYTELARALEARLPPGNAGVQALVARWHEHLHYFYTPTPEVLRGLGQLYTNDPEFSAFFEKFHADLPEYLSQAITHYVDTLDDAQLARLMAQDQREDAE